MRFNNFISIVKLSATPISIIYPLPILALLVFSLSNHNFYGLAIAIVFTFTSQAGINLWNHVNDVEEDKLAGKSNVLIESELIRKYAILLVLFLYLTSFILLIKFSVDKTSLLFFSLVAFATWIYSDKIFLGKFVRRWKDYYKTEVLTYFISAPLYTLTVWTLFEKINVKSLMVSAIFSAMFISGMFLKDIKDISGDELAGLKTLAVVFKPSKLLKISVTFIWVYYILIATSLFSGLLPKRCFVALLPSILLVYSSFKLSKQNWKISFENVKRIKLIIYSNLLSLILLILAGLFS